MIKAERLSINRFLIIASIAFLPFLNACNPKSETKIIISGQIKGANGTTIVLEQLSPFKIDTVAVAKTDQDGNFSFELDSIKLSFQRLKLDDNNVIFLHLKPGDKIEINATYPAVPKNYQISGSEDCKLLKQMNARLIESSDKLNTLKNQIVQAQKNPRINNDSLRDSSNKIAQELYKSDKAFLSDFIKSNHKSAVIYMALYQYIGPSPILMIENDLEIFEYALKELQTYNAELEQTTLLESVISKFKLQQQQINRDYVDLKPGSFAPDISMPDATGKTVSLSQLTGQKVLIYFWASWSKPSMKNFSTLINISNNYKKIGLKILMVSLDTDKEKWLSSIKTNQLESFYNVSDLLIWESPVTKIYGVKTIPHAILVDEEGKIVIISTDIEQLFNELKKIYNN
jgi:peroxiredoxin